MPSWPLLMRRQLAALYCDLSVSEFEREVAEGRLPMPLLVGNHEHWSKAQIDKQVAILLGEVEEDWRVGSPLYGDAA